MVFPDLPLEEYRICTFQLWKHKEMIHVALSLSYGTFFPSSTTHPLTSNHFCVKDALALLFIVYTANRYRGLTRGGGVPSLLNKILQDATMYFLVLSTGHLLFLFFGVFAPVRDHRVDLRSIAHKKLHVGFGETPPWDVSHRPKYRRRGESDETRSYPQPGSNVSLACRIKFTHVID